MKLRRLLIVPLLALPVLAKADWGDGVRAYQQGDYVTALRQWMPYAKVGDVTAQFNIGVMYDRGEGVRQNYAEAVRWYRKAAEQGHAAAQFNIGIMYENGRGVSQNYAEAVRWYRKAAGQGHAAARNNLGIMYSNGQGVPQDYIQAHMWYSLAAAANDRRAAENRDTVARRMTPAQIAEAQRLAANMTVGAPTTGWNALSNNQVRAVQRALNNAGFDAGPVDGQVGNRSRSALQAFQRSKEGLPVGEPDHATLQALGVR